MKSKLTAVEQVSKMAQASNTELVFLTDEVPTVELFWMGSVHLVVSPSKVETALSAINTLTALGAEST